MRKFSAVSMFFLSLMTASAVQNPPAAGVGMIQGLVTRAGTTEPVSQAQVTLQGGSADPQALQILLNTAASQGIVVTPTPGATTSETIQALSNAAVARGFPLTTSNLQSQLASLSGKTPPTTTTDRDGRFSFKDLAPGAYTVRVQKEGFFGPPEGGISQPTAAVDVRVDAGEKGDANLSMIPGAIIGGRIFDANGQLMSNAPVQVLTVAYAFGHAVLAPLVSKVTDDRGEYRLFWVPPGDYYIAVTPRPVAPSPGVPASTAVVKTFYPGVNDITESRTISIRGGEDIGGMDIGIRTPRSFKISGQVNSLIPPPTPQLGAPGVNAAVLMLLNRDETAPDDITARQLGAVPLLPTSGKFEIANILPGSYDLFARVPDPAAQVAGGQPLAWGRVRFDVRDMDINNLAITVPSSVEVKGTVTAPGGAKPGASMRVTLLPDDASIKIPAYQAVFTRSALVSPEGNFSVAAVPEGRFRVSGVAGLPADLYLADVRANAMSVFDSGFDVSTRLNSPIEVVLGSGAGTVDGIVRDGPTKVFPNATVVLIPEAKRRQNRALYFSAASDASGRFTIRGVPPGDYKLFAWESIPTFAYQNPAFIAKHEERGRAVHVGQGGTSSAELQIIPVVEKR
jgi:Carboxypeptidase regulatory-like domain